MPVCPLRKHEAVKLDVQTNFLDVQKNLCDIQKNLLARPKIVWASKKSVGRPQKLLDVQHFFGGGPKKMFWKSKQKFWTSKNVLDVQKRYTSGFWRHRQYLCLFAHDEATRLWNWIRRSLCLYLSVGRKTCPAARPTLATTIVHDRPWSSPIVDDRTEGRTENFRTDGWAKFFRLKNVSAETKFAPKQI